MIRSMTGFGRAEFNEDGVTIAVEVHSVNSRFLDLKIKTPNLLNEYEPELRKLVQSAIDRGRVTLTVFVDEPGAHTGSLRVDYDIAGKYIEIAREMNLRFGLSNGIGAREIMSMPDVLTFRDLGSSSEKIWELVSRVVKNALTAHTAMREREGTVIGQDVDRRLVSIRGHIAEIERRAPESVKANTTRLREKIVKLLDNVTADENRIAQELAIYADRVDITEECVRFNAHCDVFERELRSKKTSGKKLSFLLQELNREANTTASKSNDAGIAQIVVLIKEELEKMREQVENME
jgi:uncharacterized protein (TIGR00255 family)